MAAESRDASTALTARINLKEVEPAFRNLRRMLDEEPFRVHFFQAVRLLQRMEQDRKPVGYFITPQQEILRLHNMSDTTASENQVGSILKMQSAPGFALVDSAYGLIPARGTKVEMEFDEQQFAGSGLYLFAAVLDRFLAGYASMNSFSQLCARSTLRKEALGKWPPRAGTQALL